MSYISTDIMIVTLGIYIFLVYDSRFGMINSKLKFLYTHDSEIVNLEKSIESNEFG